MKIRIALLACLLSCGAQQEKQFEKINGLCLVAPPYEIKQVHYNPIVSVGASWVAIIPYAFCGPNQPRVIFDHPSQWHGETTAGIEEAINLAHQSNLKVMLKPHLWVRGQGWAGDLQYGTKEELEKWKLSYAKYLLHFAQLADKLDVEMVSIGTEIRQITKSNPAYWSQLIQQVRAVYPGPLTYSANWDNYENIPFWNDLDYIGIDAYFPTSKSKTPSVKELIEKSKNTKNKIAEFAKSHLKKVLFTEFGFRSRDYCTAGHWEEALEDYEINFQGQANAYEALFQTYWNENWFVGGFAWKWHYKHEEAGGKSNLEFTLQNKLAEKILKNQYSKTKKQ